MPTYQYACTACGHRLEAVQAFTDSALTECPECAGRLRKVFSSVGIVFKGSGFYRTDSRAGSSAGEGSSGASTDKSDKSEKPDKKKTEAASASKGSSGSSESSGTSSSSSSTSGSSSSSSSSATPAKAS